MLSASLTQQGHQVRVYDYAYLRRDEQTWDAVRAQLLAFRPDCVGVSACTASVGVARDLIQRTWELLGVPVVVGGPHATLNPEAMLAVDGVATVVTGDGEQILPQIVAEPERFARQIAAGGQLDVTRLPRADFAGFHAAERIRIYPLLTSRGCPFNCSFCTVHTITSRRWRARDVGSVLDELDAAVLRFSTLSEVQIHDDCPTLDVTRFKDFLRQVAARHMTAKLTVANIRADSVDDELVTLMLQARCDSVCIAAEHGNPEVFGLIGKGESLADIERAAGIIHRHGARLGLCFVIGLPGDTLERTRDSIRLARRLKPDFIFWNMAHPFRHSRIREWYEAHSATFRDDADYASYREATFRSEPPIVATPDFPAEQRQQAKFLCAVETDQYDLRQEGIGSLLASAWQYGYVWAATRSLARQTVALTRQWLRGKARGLRRRLVR